MSAAEPERTGPNRARPARTTSDQPGVAAQPVDPTRPLDVDGATTVAIGTALWALAGLVLLVFFRERLAEEDREWWLWTCLAGVGIGLLGWAYCLRRRDRLSGRRQPSRLP